MLIMRQRLHYMILLIHVMQALPHYHMGTCLLIKLRYTICFMTSEEFFFFYFGELFEHCMKHT